MSAGLPGVGLSGVFFIVSALLMLPREIVATARGRSSLQRWAAVLRHLAIAIVMIAGLEFAYAGMQLALQRLFGVAPTLRLLPLAPVLGTLAVIGCLLVGAKIAQLISRARASRAVLPEPESDRSERNRQPDAMPGWASPGSRPGTPLQSPSSSRLRRRRVPGAELRGRTNVSTDWPIGPPLNRDRRPAYGLRGADRGDHHEADPD